MRQILIARGRGLLDECIGSKLVVFSLLHKPVDRHSIVRLQGKGQLAGNLITISDTLCHQRRLRAHRRPVDLDGVSATVSNSVGPIFPVILVHLPQGEVEGELVGAVAARSGHFLGEVQTGDILLDVIMVMPVEVEL